MDVTCLSFGVCIHHPLPSEAVCVFAISGVITTYVCCTNGKVVPGSLCKPEWKYASGIRQAYHFRILVLKVIWPNCWAFHKIKSLDWTRSESWKCPHWWRSEQAPDMQLHVSAFVPVLQLFLWPVKCDPDRILIIKGIFQVMHMHTW